MESLDSVLLSWVRGTGQVWRYSEVPSLALVCWNSLNKRVASMQLQVAGGKVLSVVVGYAPRCSTDYPAFLESLCGVLKELPSGDPKVALGDFNAHLEGRV